LLFRNGFVVVESLTAFAESVPHVALWGLGNLAQSLLQGWQKASMAQEKTLATFWGVTATQASANGNAERYGIPVVANAPNQLATISNHLAQTTHLILAVKPHALTETLEQIIALMPQARQRSLSIISVAAGVSLNQLNQMVPSTHQPFVSLARAMPNLACSVNQGITAITFDEAFPQEANACLTDLFQQVGLAVVVPEPQLIAMTALTGSGPAFLLLIQEALMDAATTIGLPKALTELIIPQLLVGTALWQKASGQHPALLKNQITTPNGTTIAGLNVLESNALRAILIEAVKTATQKAQNFNQ
jgi:pyrroline-5-carboxylate reductase